MPPFFMFFILLLYIFINIIAIVYILKFLFVISSASALWSLARNKVGQLPSNPKLIKFDFEN